MQTDNPYLNIYLQNLPSNLFNLTHENLYNLAINLGNIHNTLGQIISDIIKIMGRLLHQSNSFLPKQQPQPQQRNQILISQNKPVNQVQNCKNKKNFAPNADFEKASQKDPKIAKNTINFQNYLFDKNQKQPKSTSRPFKSDVYNQLFIFSQKSKSLLYEEHSNQIAQNSCPQTQSVEISRNNQIQKILTKTHSFQQLNQFINEKNLKFDKTKKNKINQQIRKTPFFDLFDSSQTYSFELDQNFYEQKHSNTQIKFQPVIYQVNDKNQNNQNLSLPQTRKQIILNEFNNNNRLNHCQFQQPLSIDQQQKQKILINSKQQIFDSRKINQQKQKYKSIQTNQQQFDSDQYIPRREQYGRKKFDRQKMKGYVCPDCQAFYDAVSLDSKDLKILCECTSRHKSSTTFMKKHKIDNYSQNFKIN